MNDIMDYGKFTDIMQISLQMVISYTNKFLKFKCLLQYVYLHLYLLNIQTEQNQNGI